MRVIAVLILATGVCAAAAAQEKSAPKGPQNVQVLTGLSMRELRAEMDMISDALDVKCGYCHVAGNLASDDNPKKAAARRMLALTRTLNETYFAGSQPTEGTTLGHVTCFTCHRGSARPVNSPNQLSTLTK
jgi:photosynthetic reaction center cytochrome c subunit